MSRKGNQTVPTEVPPKEVTEAAPVSTEVETSVEPSVAPEAIPVQPEPTPGYTVTVDTQGVVVVTRT